MHCYPWHSVGTRAVPRHIRSTRIQLYTHSCTNRHFVGTLYCCIYIHLSCRTELVLIKMGEHRSVDSVRTHLKSCAHCMLHVLTVCYMCSLCAICAHCVLYVLTVCYMCSLYATCAHCILHVLAVCYVCLLCATCAYCMLLVLTVCYMCSLCATCAHCMLHVLTVCYMSSLCVTCAHCKSTTANY